MRKKAAGNEQSEKVPGLSAATTLRSGSSQTSRRTTGQQSNQQSNQESCLKRNRQNSRQSRLQNGSIITPGSSGKTTITALAERFPDPAPDLHSLTRRIVDPGPCIKCISHPAFNGRTIIKVVLPVLVPDLSYDGLAIASGDDALVTFAMMAQGKMDPTEILKKRAALLEYCERDTLAMVRLHAVFEDMVNPVLD